MRFAPDVIRIALLLSELCIGAQSARADDWPQFRGSRGDGSWNETGIIETFPPEGLKFLWHAAVGPGYASPVIAQGRVYLVDAELAAPSAKERMHCFDAASGKQLWTYAYDVTYPNWAFTPAPGMGPTATPIANGGKIYMIGAEARLTCLDAASGALLWDKSLDKEYQVQEFSTSASPLIEGNLLILFIGGKGGAGVLALDKDTGKEAWRALDEAETNSTPAIVTLGGKRQLIVWTQKSVTSLEPATGKAFWRHRLTTRRDYAISAPVAHDNLLLISGLMLKVEGDVPTVLWPASMNVTERILSNTSTAIFLGDYLYSAKAPGKLVCLAVKTGGQLWETEKVTVPKNGYCIHLTPNGDAVFIFTDKGDLIRARLSPAGYQEISRTHVLDPTYPFSGRNVLWPVPAFASRCIFARSDKELVCASLAKP